MLVKYNPEYVKNYKDNTFLDHYYENIYDFRKSDDTYYMTTSLEAVTTVSNSRKYFTTDQIIKNRLEPYFILSPWTTRETPVMCINMTDISSAIKLSVFWHTFQYIPEIDDDGAYLYSEEFDEEYEIPSYTLINFDKSNPYSYKKAAGEKVDSDDDEEKIAKHLIAVKKFSDSEESTKYYCPLLY